MKLWNNNTTDSSLGLSKIIEKFTVGEDKIWDLYLAEADVKGSLAHAQMLFEIDLLTEKELEDIKIGLQQILNRIEQGTFVIEEGVEDVHSQIEFLLTEAIGEAGKKIHSGRSRNDQSLLDIKLFIKSEIKILAQKSELVFDKLLSLSEQHKNDLLPGYTHFQLAMPSSFGLWFGAYAESLCDDLELLIAAYNVANKNPLGSAAGYGSSFPLDRERTTELLAFETMNYNVVYAQMTRGKTEKIMAIAMAGVAATLNKLAMDVCLYMNQNFAFISFPKELTTGSSIMPHKKNPDVFELIRAKCNRIQALPHELALLTNNLPSGYHRDMQLTKECLFPAIMSLKDCLDMLLLMLGHIRVQENLLDDDKYKLLFTVEAVNEKVLSGTPFRDAYREVSAQVEADAFQYEGLLAHQHAGSMGNLCNAEIQKMFKRKMQAFA